MQMIKIKYIGLIFGFFALIMGCTTDQKSSQKAAEQQQQTYTCPMHPQVIKHEMGTCPICAMDLVPFEKK